MPARVMRYVMTRAETKNAANVASAHAARDTISARRSASRCSITDIRWSSTGALGRGARCRTLPRRATGASVLRRGGCLGRALGGALAGRLPELLHGLADGATKLRQTTRPEDDQDDHQEKHDVCPVDTKHFEAD